ncbi:tyrosine-type recombinase/integrase [Desulfobacter sp. UBA2225]|uniref:tyrosine-type recombinase/integrase n=1 Tax=Desulfobacter sp. UBA2225 TaxID=1961413 RepID=UPI002579A55B|nr:integrase arm-type DNA-binding domain-containing protein [Desulfobacter sp. UBA2225]
MPKRVKNLTAVEVSRIKAPGRHAVGTIAGLLMVVKPSGTKSWIFRTKIGNKRRSIGLGGYPDVTLAMAHEKARSIKKMVESGFDPVEEKRKHRDALKKEQAQYLTFADAARRCHRKKAAEFKSDKHAKDWISSVERHVNPIIGDISVSDIDLPEILSVLKPIWTEKTETASRVRQRVEQVLNWATVSGYRTGENPARWVGNLSEILPKPSKIKNEQHFKALPYQEIYEFMIQLRKRPAMTARALEWIILTACRSSEARGATWDEIDMVNRIWVIPSERMKMDREHRVPLCDDAISLLEKLPRFEGSNYLFTAARGGMLSDMSISMLCRRMKVSAVPHGFRATFKTWATEQTAFPDLMSEMCLAHKVGNDVREAYARGDLLDKRRNLMNSWVEYINKEPACTDNVIPIRKIID